MKLPATKCRHNLWQLSWLRVRVYSRIYGLKQYESVRLKTKMTRQRLVDVVHIKFQQRKKFIYYSLLPYLRCYADYAL